MVPLAAAAALVLILLTALVQPSTAAADPIDLSTPRPPAAQSTDPPVSLAPDQSALAGPSESASSDPSSPPSQPSDPPDASGSATPSPTDGPSGSGSSDPSGSGSGSQPPTGGGSSEPPTPPGSSTSSGPTPTPPSLSAGSGSSSSSSGASSGSGSTAPTGGTTTPAPPDKPEPEAAPAVRNAKWADALFEAKLVKPSNLATLAPSVNTVPVVTARAVCGGIVFANPDSAYSAVVAYGSFDKSPQAPVTLRPTTTKFVPITGKQVDWAAKSQDAGSGASTEVVGAAGYGESVKIPQCPATPGEIHAVAMAPCLARGQNAVIMVDRGTETAERSELSWRISRKDDPLVLAQGVLGRTGVSSVDLSSFGVGTYTVVVLQDGTVKDQVDFAALDCIATTADVCDRVTVTNPIRNPVPVTVTWRTDGSSSKQAKGAKMVTLEPGSEYDVPAVAGSVQWSAISTGSQTAARPTATAGQSVTPSLIGDAGSDRTAAVSKGCVRPSASQARNGSVTGPTQGSATSPGATSPSGRVDPSGTGSSGGTPSTTDDPGTDVAGSAVLLGGIAVGGAALVWLLAALIRRRP